MFTIDKDKALCFHPKSVNIFFWFLHENILCVDIFSDLSMKTYFVVLIRHTMHVFMEK